MSKQYKILEANTPIELEEKVNTMIKYGWRPEGGIATNPPKYTQSIVREVEDIKVENSSDNSKQLLHG